MSRTCVKGPNATSRMARAVITVYDAREQAKQRQTVQFEGDGTWEHGGEVNNHGRLHAEARLDRLATRGGCIGNGRAS